MNAGAYGKSMKDVVLSTKCIDYTGKIYSLDANVQEFGYRKSIYSSNKYIILEAVLKLEQGNKSDIEKKMNEYLTKRKETQPFDKPSAGSTFKRDEFITSKLIDECGLKGYKIGGAMVSTKHAGFIVNEDNAIADDVIKLIDYVKKVVYEKTGKKIELEIEIVGEK